MDSSFNQSVDKSDMYSVLMQFPEQINDALRIGSEISVPLLNPKHIIICAMGGSAISGNILENYLSDKIDIPIVVLRDYTLPQWVSPSDLVICNSYSGNTEETLNCFREARERAISVVSVTSGGTLEKRTLQQNQTIVKIPADLQPRASIAYLLIPLICIVEKLGFYNPRPEIHALIEDIKKMREELGMPVPFEKNRAKQFAKEMHGKLPWVYGSGILAAVARRFKTQLNENPKMLASYDTIPESNHNDFNAWPSDDKAKESAVILLRYEGEHERNRKRFDIAKKLVFNNAGSIREIWSRGSNDLSKIMTTLYMADMISYYLALLRNVDPTPVIYIERLKEELKRE